MSKRSEAAKEESSRIKERNKQSYVENVFMHVHVLQQFFSHRFIINFILFA